MSRRKTRKIGSSGPPRPILRMLRMLRMLLATSSLPLIIPSSRAIWSETPDRLGQRFGPKSRFTRAGDLKNLRKPPRFVVDDLLLVLLGRVDVSLSRFGPGRTSTTRLAAAQGTASWTGRNVVAGGASSETR